MRRARDGSRLGIIAASLGALALLASRGEATGPRLTGVTQVTATRQEGSEGMVFGFDRVRLKWSGRVNEVTRYMVQVDMIKVAVDADKDGDTPGLIKDAVITLDTGAGTSLLAGKFKTPIGMEFNASGARLDVVKRGLGQRLVFERNAGMMFRAEEPAGLPVGLAAGVFNAGPNRANGVGDPASGQDYTVAARVTVRPHERLYGELASGAALSSVSGQDDVLLSGVGVRFRPSDDLALKAEALWRDDPQNGGADGVDFYLQAGYMIRPNLEHVLKYERLDVTDGGEDRADLTLGLNLFLNPQAHSQSRVQVNYVASDAPGRDALQVMLQAAF